MRFLIIGLSIIFTLNSYADKSLTEQLDQKRQKGSKSMPAHVKKEFSRALKELKASGIEQKAVKHGQMVPSFKINGLDFKNFYTKKPVVLKFYRGNWCPYCQIEMNAYEKSKDKIEAKGYQLIVLTPDTKKEIKKFRNKQSISFSIFQDKDNYIAKKFGIAFKLDEKVEKLYQGFGINLKRNQENDMGELPLPGTYVIDKKGKIKFAFIDADYTKRLDPIELLKHL